MNIGIPKEIKIEEHRVSSSAFGLCANLSNADTRYLSSSDAGFSSGFNDEEYMGAGATILDSAEEVWSASRT